MNTDQCSYISHWWLIINCCYICSTVCVEKARAGLCIGCSGCDGNHGTDGCNCKTDSR